MHRATNRSTNGKGEDEDDGGSSLARRSKPAQNVAPAGRLRLGSGCGSQAFALAANPGWALNLVMLLATSTAGTPYHAVIAMLYRGGWDVVNAPS